MPDYTISEAKEKLARAYAAYADGKTPLGVDNLTEAEKIWFLFFLYDDPEVGQGIRPFKSIRESDSFLGRGGGDYKTGVKVLSNFLTHNGYGKFRLGSSSSDIKKLFGDEKDKGGTEYIWAKINKDVGTTWGVLLEKQKIFLILGFYLLKLHYGLDRLPEIYTKRFDEGEELGILVFGSATGAYSTFVRDINAAFFGLSDQFIEKRLKEDPALNRSVLDWALGSSKTDPKAIYNDFKETLKNVNVFKVDFDDKIKEAADLLLSVTGKASGSTTPESAAINALKTSQEKSEGAVAKLTTEEVDKELKADGGLGDTLEQCILLTKLADFAEHRKGIRFLILPSMSESVETPYGGRVIPVKCENIGSFVNLCSSPYSIYDYSKELTTAIHGKIEYDFEIVKIHEDSSGTIEEYPLLFGGQTDKTKAIPKIVELNIVDSSAINRDSSGPITIAEQKRLVGVIGLGTDEEIMTSTALTDLTIKYKGENFATARTNVDVDLKIDIPHLLIFQAVFEASRGEGDKYRYSVLDLITYLNNSQMSNGNKKNGSKYYSPVYKTRYNRLAMKIIPRWISKSVLDKELYKNIKKYVKDSSLYLDLALVDYTINKDEVLNKASITINYKGYIRSHLNDAMTDCLNTSEGMSELEQQEKDFIEELDKLSCVKEVRQKITERNKLSMEETQKANRTTSRVNSRKRIFEGLIERNKLFFFKYNVSNILSDNVDRESKKIINPTQVHRNITLKENLKENIMAFEDLESEITVDTVAMSNSNEKLSFFYLGDLIDVLMNVMYKEYTPNGTRGIELPAEGFVNFPLKVILPTFNAVTLDVDKGTFTKEKEISLADVPIASSYFSKWFQKEVIDMDVVHYPLGTMMNKIINTLLNNVLNDNCYLDGNPERKYFSVKSDFGKFAKAPSGKGRQKHSNTTVFDNLIKKGSKVKKAPKTKVNTRDDNTASAHLATATAPFFRKDFDLKRTDHCNYLIVYEQISAFSDYSKINLSKLNYQNEFQKYAIPEFKIRNIKKEKITKGGKEFIINTPGSLTQKISFKKTDIPYQRETRYFADNLNSLSQLASVHNVTITTKPLLTMFPGMLIWVDAGLMDPPQTVNSIAWLLGMGGFHVTTEVTHKAKITVSKLNRVGFTTVIEGVYVNNGADSHDNGGCGDGTNTAEGAAEKEVPEKTETTSSSFGGGVSTQSNPGADNSDATEAEPPQTTVVTIPSAVGQADAIDLYDATVHDDPVGKNVFASGALYYVIKEKIKDETQKGTGVKLKIAILGDREYWTTNFLTNRGKTVTFI
jgi:hypothetical protein